MKLYLKLKHRVKYVQQNIPAAIVMGLSPTGLHVVRTLGRAGVQVIGIARRIQAGCTSRYLSRCIIENEENVLLEKISGIYFDLKKEQKKPVLIPTSDEDVDFVIKNAEQLKKYYSFQSSYLDGIAEKIMTKDTFYSLCEKNDVLYPKLIETTKKDLIKIAKIIKYPCIAKPSRIHDVKEQMGGAKGWIFNDETDVILTLNHIPENSGKIIVQEIIPGPESEITLYCAHIDKHGTIRQEFTARKLRQYPPCFGSASLVQSNEERDTENISRYLLSVLGYHGIASTEYKRHPVTGKLMIIEVNVRPSLWFSISEAAGKSVVLSLYNELAGMKQKITEINQINGIKWKYGTKDAWSKIYYKIKKNIILPEPDINVAGISKKVIYPVYDTDDIMPIFTEIYSITKKAISRMLKKIKK